MTYQKLTGYEYGHAAEFGLLCVYIREPEILFDFVKPVYFRSPIHTDIARITHDALRGKDLRSDRLSKRVLWAMVWKSLLEGKRSRAYEIRKAYKEVVEDIFDTDLDLSDKQHWRDLAVTFSREAEFREALVEAERFINAKNYVDAVRTIVDTHEKHLPALAEAKSLRAELLTSLVADSNDSDDIENFVVYPIVPKNGGVLIFGIPKELNSWMGAALALDIAFGAEKALGYFPIPKAATVLYVQVEDTRAMTRQRLRLLAQQQVRSSSKTLFNLKIVTRCSLNLMDPESVKALEEVIKKFKPDVVIFDVLRRLFRGNVLDAKDTAEFLYVLDKLRDKWNCAVVLVHHARKGESAEIQTKALGSVNVAAWADVLVFLSGKRRVGEGTVSNLNIDSKAAASVEENLVLRVDETKTPMVRVLDQERCEIGVLRACVRKHPGLSQEQLIKASGIGEKKFRPLVEKAIQRGLLDVKHGNRKSLKYFIPRKR
jgi:hypothetical protein